MGGNFKVFTTSGFERDSKHLKKKMPEVLVQVQELVKVLKIDPYNRSYSHDIKKLVVVKPGAGQFRIRSGNYRLRYDIFGRDVVLYSVRDRKEVY